MIYEIFIEPNVHAARKKLPANVRQRMRQAINDLAQEPRPSQSRPLDTSGLDVPTNIEIRRLRLESWRLIYAVSDDESWVWVLGLHRRPPYDYTDLSEIVRKLQ